MIRALHARYVLDASVAAKWFTRHDESNRDQAVSLRTMHQSGACTLVIPEFGLLELANAVRFSAKAAEPDTVAALALLERLRLETVPLDWELLRKSSAIAWAHGVALHDAAYVALAERIGFPFITADEVLVKRMAGHSLVVPLRELVFG